MTSYLRRVVRSLTTRAPLICIGHSHTENIAAAAAALDVPIACYNFWRYQNILVRTGEAVDFTPEFRSQLAAPVFSFVGGAVHHDIGLCAHPRPYDFVWPERPDLPVSEGAELIPYAGIHAAIRARVQQYFDIMAAIRAAVQGPVFHMESPPAYANEVAPNDPDWVMFHGEGQQIAPAWMRYKLWRVHSAIVAARCAETGITFVPAPAEALDAQGFLARPFHGTVAHANAEYGALVLRQMLSLAGTDSVAKRVRRAISA